MSPLRGSSTDVPGCLPRLHQRLLHLWQAPTLDHVLALQWLVKQPNGIFARIARPRHHYIEQQSFWARKLCDSEGPSGRSPPGGTDT
ncbi:MAG TPA: hypothetical protein VH593_29680 [Ktedonobacteraceae bacterium]